jgi:phosphoribosylanthranilate isomerase
MTQIKICGFTTRSAVEAATRLGIDYMGFVFASSKRQISPEQVRELTNGMQTPKRIGVFVNETIEQLLRIAEFAGLDGFQLHGNESPAFCRTLKERSNKLVWKAWRVGGEAIDHSISEYISVVDALLLDAYHPLQMGGTGESFRWESITQIRDSAPRTALFVAGGLSAGNVKSLIDLYHPDGVDVSSGVETDGIKDPAKMKQFMEKVREQS